MRLDHLLSRETYTRPRAWMSLRSTLWHLTLFGFERSVKDSQNGHSSLIGAYTESVTRFWFESTLVTDLNIFVLRDGGVAQLGENARGQEFESLNHLVFDSDTNRNFCSLKTA